MFDNCRLGSSIGFHKDGTIKSQIVFGDSIKNGKCPKELKRFFYNEKGEITHYSVGKEDGYSKYANGKVMFDWSYKGGLFSRKDYFENGKINLEKYFKYNASEDSYNIKTGTWKYYNKDGTLEKTEVYINGVKQ